MPNRAKSAPTSMASGITSANTSVKLVVVMFVRDLFRRGRMTGGGGEEWGNTRVSSDAADNG